MHEFAVYFTNMLECYNPWQIQQLYRERPDTEIVFDELKKQSGFCGYCAQSGATTELAVQLLTIKSSLLNSECRILRPRVTRECCARNPHEG